MSYEPTTWQLGQAGGTAINPTRLNKMETGIADAHTLVAGLASADHTHTSADITDATAANTIDTIVKRDSTGSIAVTAVSGLSTATGGTQAVPKSQMDTALTGKSDVGHTHTAAAVGAVEAVTTNLRMQVLTQAAYDTLAGIEDATTLYIIQG